MKKNHCEAVRCLLPGLFLFLGLTNVVEALAAVHLVPLRSTRHALSASIQGKTQAESKTAKEFAELLFKAADEQSREELLRTHDYLLNRELLRSILQQVEISRAQGEVKTAPAAFEIMAWLAPKFKEQKFLPETLLNFGVQHLTFREYDLALKYFVLCQAVARQAQNITTLNQARLNIGNLYFLQSNYHKAETYYLEVFNGLPKDTFSLNLLRVTNNLGALYYRQGDYARALEKMETVLALGLQAEQLPQTETEKAVTLDVVLKARINRGAVRLAQSEVENARLDFQHASQIAQVNKLPDLEGQALNGLASTYEAQGNLAAAITTFEASLKLLQSRQQKNGQAFILSNLGNSYRLLGDHTKALAYFEQALTLAKQFGEAEPRWKTLTRAARSYRALGKPQDALLALEEAMQVVEKIRQQAATDPAARKNVFEGRLAPYYEMADLQVSLKNNESAYHWIQKSKARVLLEVMQGGQDHVFDLLPEVERNHVNALQQEIKTLTSRAQAEASKKASPEVMARLDAEIKSKRQNQTEFVAHLYTTHPELALRRGELQALSPEKISELLPNANSVILEYLIADDISYLFVLSKLSAVALDIQVYPLKTTRQELQISIEQFRRRLANKDFSYQAQATTLYQLLIAPAAQQLRGKNALLIVPDAALWELPFQALLDADKKFLINQYALSFVPSLPVLHQMTRLRMRQLALPPSHQLLAVGNPLRGEPGGVSVYPALLDETVSRLPETDRQVRHLKVMYGATKSQLYQGAAAQEEAIKAALSNYRIIHFATHGFLENGNPLQSALLLARPAPKSKEDGVLEAREIMNLHLQADLAVLSACETARGKIGTGEGLIGLSWSFLIAGCPTLVVSQWKLESKSTTDLMLAFHQRMKGYAMPRQGALPIAEAMRQAALQLQQKKEFAHPFYWAGFIVMGDGWKKIE